MEELTPEELELIGVGFTIATGELWSSFSSFHEAAEKIMGEAILNTSFRHPEVWEKLRDEFKEKVKRANA